MSTPSISYKRHRFPPEIITHAVWLYCRFNFSFREVEEMFLERGIGVSYETIRRWLQNSGPPLHEDYVADSLSRAISGIWTKPLSRLRAVNSGCGVRLISMVLFWTKSFRTDAIRQQPNAYWLD
jgi:hypothetical protein